MGKKKIRVKTSILFLHIELAHYLKKELYNQYSSIIHIDGTCRTQIVNDKNSLTYKVLKDLKKKGSDILVNTSFNISKDPVVFDLYDVYVNMKRMNIKFVLMDDGLYQTNDI